MNNSEQHSMDRFALPVGARLAGEGVIEIAFAGKPGSYREVACQRHHTRNMFLCANPIKTIKACSEIDCHGRSRPAALP